MALFKVPGWSIPTAPIQEDSRHGRTSKKRKLTNTKSWRLLKKLVHDRQRVPKNLSFMASPQTRGRKISHALLPLLGLPEEIRKKGGNMLMPLCQIKLKLPQYL